MSVSPNPKPTLLGTAGSDRLYGNEEDDSIYGAEGNDSIVGGTGDDRIWGGTGDDYWMDGGDGEDVIEGGSGNDKLAGGKGNDFLQGDYGDRVGWAKDANGQYIYTGPVDYSGNGFAGTPFPDQAATRTYPSAPTFSQSASSQTAGSFQTGTSSAPQTASQTVDIPATIF